MKRPVVVLGTLAGLAAAYVGIVVFSPLLRAQPQPIPAGAAPLPGTPAEEVSWREVRFYVGGEQLRGRLYLPRKAGGRVPGVVLNNGLGGTQAVVVHTYADRFAQAGMAALTYDYRHFGASGGEPRQFYMSDLQVADCRGAIAYLRGLPEVDSERIAIWGTSSSGGYGLQIAAEDGGIACVCAQCPSLDHAADSRLIFQREGIGYFLRLFFHAARDKGRARFGLSAHHIAIVGKPGTAAIFTAPGVFEACAPIYGPSFRNELCARVMLTPHGKTAADVLEQVRCPALIQICEHDAMVAPAGTLRMAQRMGTLAELQCYPIGHYDIYQGAHFARAVADQLAFFSRHLCRPATSATA